MDDTQPNVTDEPPFRTALTQLLQTARENGIDVEGGWDIDGHDGHPDWDVVVTVVERADGDDGDGAAVLAPRPAVAFARRRQYIWTRPVSHSSRTVDPHHGTAALSIPGANALLLLRGARRKKR